MYIEIDGRLEAADLELKFIKTNIRLKLIGSVNFHTLLILFLEPGNIV